MGGVEARDGPLKSAVIVLAIAGSPRRGGNSDLLHAQKKFEMR
jgi:hypothetical protein